MSFKQQLHGSRKRKHFNFKGKGEKSKKKMKAAIRGLRNKDRKVGELSVLIKSGEIKARQGEIKAL